MTVSKLIVSLKLYLNLLIDLLFCPLFLSLPGRWAHGRRYRFAPKVSQQAVRTAVVAHVFYPELLPEVVACWHSIPSRPTLYITTLAEYIDVVQNELKDIPDARIHATINRGRDIAPFLRLLQSGALDAYDAILKLHTKRSPHLLSGNIRRRMLFATIAGNTGVVNQIVHQFRDDKIGIVGWGRSFQTHPHYWMTNRERVTFLCNKMDPPPTPTVAFFEGSMFWVRPDALMPLRSLQLTDYDFEAEAGQLDGTLHHAIERLFCLSAREAGYETRSVGGRFLY